MMRKWIFLIAGTLLILSLMILPRNATKVVRAQSIPSAYDLIDAVNQFRANNGLHTVAANTQLMNSAQAHSEYQAFIGTWSHEGPGGSNETDRAIAAGYGDGGSVICDEAVAIANTQKDLDYVLYTLWDDYAHRDLVLLNSRYYDVGAGVAVQDGLVYYTVDVCVISGSGGYSNSSTQPAATTVVEGAGATEVVQPSATQASVSEVITSMQTVTPRPDGSIVHKVQAGQTMWNIAIEYGMKVVDLATMNGISPSDPVVYVGQEIVVRLPFTETATATITSTPRPPTRTLRPTYTPRPPTQSPTITSTYTATPRPILPPMPALEKLNRRTIGIAIVILCGLGLVIVIGMGGSKEKIE